ncbi:MAG: hypothetical protein CM15mP83_5790 [Flavobacteriaceae bacterium]|nr:MAG: hypothetical protein CM15mP83_5790 [Flavobacteriaceae bacterium]
MPVQKKDESADLEIGGSYRWRRNGEAHMLNPATIAKLQVATRQNKYESYEEFAKLVNDQSRQLMTIRGMFSFTDLDPYQLRGRALDCNRKALQNRCNVTGINQ